MHVLLTEFGIFFMVLVGRVCLNKKTLILSVVIVCFVLITWMSDQVYSDVVRRNQILVPLGTSLSYIVSNSGRQIGY